MILSPSAAETGGEGSTEVVSRRNIILGASLTGLAWPAAAQVTETFVAASDGQAESIRIANALVTRLGSGANHIRSEGSRGVADAVARLDDRSRPVAAILPSTALAFMEQTGAPSRNVHAHRLIGQLDVLTLQTLASPRIGDPRQLAGQKVNLGPRGSPTQVSASVLLDQISLRVDPLYLDHEHACAAVIRGEISAMMLLAPKPARLFFEINPSDAVHFISLPEPQARAAGMTATQILPTDYPTIGVGVGVNTVAVPLVLGCFGWRPGSDNFIALTRLADLLAKRGSGLPGFDMGAPVSGWRRFPPVAEWLAQGKYGPIRENASADTQQTDARPGESRAKSAAPDHMHSAVTPEPDQKEKLFQEFLAWRRSR